MRRLASVLALSVTLTACGTHTTQSDKTTPSMQRRLEAPVRASTSISVKTPASTSTSTTVAEIPTTTTTRKPFDYHDLPDWYAWHKIGKCEQPGKTPDGIAWTHHGDYNGGLGILNSSWRGYRKEAGVNVEFAYNASPYQQILVARVIRKHFGFSGWTSVPSCTGKL